MALILVDSFDEDKFGIDKSVYASKMSVTGAKLNTLNINGPDGKPKVTIFLDSMDVALHCDMPEATKEFFDHVSMYGKNQFADEEHDEIVIEGHKIAIGKKIEREFDGKKIIITNIDELKRIIDEA